MTVSPFFNRKLLCGIEISLTRLGIGTDLPGASARAGGVRTVAARITARLRNVRIGLESPANLLGERRDLNGRSPPRNRPRRGGPGISMNDRGNLGRSNLIQQPRLAMVRA